MDKFKYRIGDKIYIQKPLVLGQIRQLISLLDGLVIPRDIDVMGLISILGDKLPQALAIVLVTEGTELKDKDIMALAKEIEFEISPEQTLEVVEDFFDCNPIASLLERLSVVVNKIAEKVQQTGSKNSSASSLEETSQSEMPSSGGIHSRNASHTLNIRREM